MSTFAPKWICAAVFTGLLAGCSSPDAHEEVAPPSAEAVTVAPGPGSLVAVHGMVLFGKESLHLSHIPIFQQPHNMQVVVEVRIADGVPAASQVFVDKLYTVRPNAFSLYDLSQGTLTKIKGTIFSGSFEQGGRPMFANVDFEVTRVVYEIGLDPHTPTRPTLDYLAVGTPADPYLVHLIDSLQSFDSVTGIVLPADSALDAASLERGTFVSIQGGVNAVGQRLAPGAQVEATFAPAAARDNDSGPTASTDVSVRGELYCSTAPDFFTFCDVLPPVTPVPPPLPAADDSGVSAR